MFKQFVTFVYDKRDFYYPRFIGILCLSLFGILLARLMNHNMFEHILLVCCLLIPLTGIFATFTQWFFEFKTIKKVDAVKHHDEWDEIIPWGQSYLNESRRVLDEKTQKAINALNKYDGSFKSAQDAAYLIDTMSKIYKSK